MDGVLLRHLGRYDRAEASLKEAIALAEPHNLTMRLWPLMELGLLYLHVHKDQLARPCAEKALRLLAEGEDDYYHNWLPLFRVDALRILGYVLLHEGHLPEAEETFRRAVAEELKTATLAVTVEARTGLAEALMSQGKRSAALAEAEMIFRFLMTQALESHMEPLLIPLVCGRVFAAHDDPRAAEALTVGYREMMKRAATIDDEELRRSYLENVETNRELAVEYWRVASNLPTGRGPSAGATEAAP
jgi:tetratricopeptide (TPR) repeat protein